MPDEKDWRITNQINYLRGKELIYGQYHPKCEEWEHEHCEFCWGKFIESSYGYCTVDTNYWICEECYNHFKIMFEFN